MQIKGFVYLILISILIMFAYLFINNNNHSFFDNLRISSFNVISILSGTGYVTDDFGLWGEFPLIFFLFLMFIGGCAGSTTCGIKVFRLQILFVFIKNQIKKLIYPNRILVLSYNKEKIEDSFINSVIIFIFSYLILFLIISILLSISGLDFLSAISGAATSISNVGPGLGDMIGPNGNFSEWNKWKSTISNELSNGNSIYLSSSGSTYDNNGKINFCPSHAFSITAYNASTDLFTIYNPWGVASSWSRHNHSFQTSWETIFKLNAWLYWT